MNDCGGCQHFLKIKKGNWGNSGLCLSFDCRADEDGGHRCERFKAKKYERERERIEEHF
jgi:hypothetical protein